MQKESPGRAATTSTAGWVVQRRARVKAIQPGAPMSRPTPAASGAGDLEQRLTMRRILGLRKSDVGHLDDQTRAPTPMINYEDQLRVQGAYSRRAAKALLEPPSSCISWPPGFPISGSRKSLVMRTIVACTALLFGASLA